MFTPSDRGESLRCRMRMSSILSSLRALDPDDVFAFTTEKRVRVRHRWLGMLYYGLLVVIGMYVVGYQLIIKKQYIKREPLHGGAIYASLKPAAEPTAIDSLPYCAQSARPNADALRCVTWSDALTSEASDGRLLIGTRVSRTVQERSPSCSEYDYGCNPWRKRSPRADVYMGDVESASVLIQHDISDRDARLASTGGSMSSTDTHNGKWARRPALIMGDGGRATTTPRRSGDLVSVRDLLAVAGVRLEDPSTDAEGSNSLRYAGMTLVVTTEYVLGSGDYSYRVE